MENVSDMVETPGPTHEVMETVKESAQHVKATVTQEAARAIDSIRTSAMEQVARQKSELANSLRSVDEALRDTSALLVNSPLAPQVERVADILTQASQFVEHHGIEDLGVALRRLSLQHPVAFYAGIFAVGFAAGRFLSSTEHRPIEQPSLEINLLDEAPVLEVEYQPIPEQVVTHHGSY